MKNIIYKMNKFSKFFIYGSILIAISSFNTSNLKLSEKQTSKESAWCPVSYSFNSTVTFVSGAVSPQYGTELVNYNFNSWSGGSYDWYGSICFTVQFPATHPAGTLTFSRNGTVLQTINIARNSGVVYDLCDSFLCGGQYVIDFN